MSPRPSRQPRVTLAGDRGQSGRRRSPRSARPASARSAPVRLCAEADRCTLRILFYEGPPMDYADAVAAFFAPRPAGTVLPEVVTGGSPARRLRDACEPVAMHAVWNRLTNERLAELGLDFLGAYVGGRAAALGEPVGAVVASSFAWFEPGLVAALYDGARAAIAQPVLLAARDEATVASLSAVLGGGDPTEVADLLAGAAVAADGTGRPIFSGLRDRGRPADPGQRLWWACDLVREHRGDSHVAVAAAAGLGPRLGGRRPAHGRRAGRADRRRGPHRSAGAVGRRRTGGPVSPTCAPSLKRGASGASRPGPSRPTCSSGPRADGYPDASAAR